MDSFICICTMHQLWNIIIWMIRICVSFLTNNLKSRSRSLTPKLVFLICLWTIFKIFNEFVTIWLPFHGLAFWLQGTWDLSYPIRNQNHTPCIEKRNLKHWISREVPTYWKLLKQLYRQRTQSISSSLRSWNSNWGVNKKKKKKKR